MGKLTDSQIQGWVRAGVPVAGRSDGDGLTFTLTAKGAASWVLRYRIDERQRELTLGSYPEIALTKARSLARAVLSRIEIGEDVATTRMEERLMRVQGGTFRELAEDYLERVGPTLAPTTAKEARRFLDKDVLPRIGSVQAADVSAAHVVAVVERIAARSQTVARRTFELLSVVFSHGTAKRRVPGNPCMGLKVSAIIGAPKPKRERIKLSRDELRAVLAGLPLLGRANELSARILLATCVRKGELLSARWANVDLARGLWTIPDEDSKTGQGFVIPLAPQVVGWFESLKALAGSSSAVLPGRGVRYGKRRGTASRSTLNCALGRLAVGARKFSPHDLRSTARSYLAELGVGVLVAERCLNHSLGGLVAVYDKHDYLDERRRALGLWVAFLEKIERGEEPGAGDSGNVVELRAA